MQLDGLLRKISVDELGNSYLIIYVPGAGGVTVRVRVDLDVLANQITDFHPE